MSNILEKSINHLSTVADLYWRTSQPIHRLLLCPLQLLLLIFPSMKKVPSCNSKFNMAVCRSWLAHIRASTQKRVNFEERTSVPVEGQNYCRHKHPQQGLFLLTAARLSFLHDFEIALNSEHLFWPRNLPVHDQNPKNYWALHRIISILQPG